MRLACWFLTAWATVSHSSSTSRLGTAAEAEESHPPEISSLQIRDVLDDEVDLSREQKQQKWAFMPHNPSGFVEKFVANQETGGVSASTSENARTSQADSSEAFIPRDRTNANRPPQSLHGNGDPITSSDAHRVDDRTLLDVFAESAKEYLTTRLVSGRFVDLDWSLRFAPTISTLMSSVSLSCVHRSPKLTLNVVGTGDHSVANRLACAMCVSGLATIT
jgi:hypothetical protein